MMDILRPSSALVLPILVAFSIIAFRGSDATRCEDNDYRVRSRSTTEGSTKYCCKVERYVDGVDKSQFYCEGGCCGEKNDEYCCAHLSDEELGYVIGFSIFGVVVVVVVAVILFFVFRYACRQYREQKEHTKQFKEAYRAQVMSELMEEGDQPPVTSPLGTIVHPMVSDRSEA